MIEIWKDVAGHEKDYKISNFGRIYSKPKNNSKGYGCNHNGMFLKPHYSKTRYPATTLNKKTYSIHRLVAAHFIENKENKKIVHHIDRNTNNFHVSNLEWKTQRENIQEAHDGGHWKKTKRVVAAGRLAGIRSRIFSIEQASMIRSLSKHYSIASIARLVLVAGNVVSKIIKNETYKIERGDRDV